MSSCSGLKYVKHDNGLLQDILTCLTDEYYYTDHSYSIWIPGVFNMTQLSQSHESAMLLCRVWRINTNAFHSNWFDVIVHAVDGVSLQYFLSNVNLQR